MALALKLARKSPPRPTNFRVGAILVDAENNIILAEGYTLELYGNTHAEQCCLIKLSEQHATTEERLADFLPADIVLYTTMEPCNKRLSGNLSCVDRIIRLGDVIKKVYVGVREPGKFVGNNIGSKRLKDAGIEVEQVPGFEHEILSVATVGHVQEPSNTFKDK